MNSTSHSQFDKYVLLQFKTGLCEQQRELQHVLEETEKEIRELAGSGPSDAVDLACFNSSRELMFAHSSQNRKQLRLVQLALEHIGNGSFGTCTACQGPIGLKRLQAVPWASHCILCQEQSEHIGFDESVSYSHTFLAHGT